MDTEGTVPEAQHPYIDPAVVRRKASRSTESFSNEKQRNQEVDAEAVLAHDEEEVEGARTQRQIFYRRYRPFILGGIAAVILGWWISATILEATRHRWYINFNLIINEIIDLSFSTRIVQTLFAWFFILYASSSFSFSHQG